MCAPFVMWHLILCAVKVKKVWTLRGKSEIGIWDGELLWRFSPTMKFYVSNWSQTASYVFFVSRLLRAVKTCHKTSLDAFVVLCRSPLDRAEWKKLKSYHRWQTKKREWRGGGGWTENKQMATHWLITFSEPAWPISLRDRRFKIDSRNNMK